MELRSAAADAAAAWAGLSPQERELAVAELDPRARELALAALRTTLGGGDGAAGLAARVQDCKQELVNLLELSLDGDEAKSTISHAASALEREPAFAEELVRSVVRVVASVLERDQAPLGRRAEPTLGADASAPVREQASAASDSQGGDGAESATGAASSVDTSALAKVILDLHQGLGEVDFSAVELAHELGRAMSSTSADASSLAGEQDTIEGESAISVGWSMSVDDPDVRERAARALAAAAPAAGRRACRRELDALCEHLLRDDDGDVRVACAEALVAVAPVAGDAGRELAVVTLCTCLKQDQESSVMRAATQALQDLGADAQAVESLCARAGDEGSSWEGRVLAACQLVRTSSWPRPRSQLAQVAKRPSPQVDALLARLQDTNPVEERLAAAVALCALGRQTGWASPGLVADASGGSVVVVLTLPAAQAAMRIEVHFHGQHAAAATKNTLGMSLSVFESLADRSQTLLHMAAVKNSEVAALALLEARAAVDSKTADGSTPLHVAAQEGGAQVLPALLEAGAPLDLPTTLGFTPLHVAAQVGNARVISALLGAHAALHLQTPYGSTPLHLAALSGHVEASSALVRVFPRARFF